ncbi:hypothetical protein MIZ03_3692 [Rhodoferax lithotrophicus]|uniref:Uncharacterized protein n=1 Tax=Rhodoferax lithotrophicus TaxID=2798804 RepID=A0ABM7MR22_9BURK|nr:hypothetical protein MIZ03_3692 [Rhodoferax sp. MIZ03]
MISNHVTAQAQIIRHTGTLQLALSGQYSGLMACGYPFLNSSNLLSIQ